MYALELAIPAINNDANVYVVGLLLVGLLVSD